MTENRKITKKKSSNSRIRAWLTTQNIIFVVVISIFLISVIWSKPLGDLFGRIPYPERENTSIPTTLPGTPTRLPDEYYTNVDMLTGVILGVVILAMIVVVGTFAILLRDRRRFN
jgi:hypothetical protein